MNRGLTLVELVITIGLAGIIGIPLGMLLTEHMQASVDSRDSTLAMNFARAEMERLDSFDNFFATDLELTVTPVETAVASHPAYHLVRTVSCQVGDCGTSLSAQGVKRIEVRVTQSVSASIPRRELVKLITYRTKSVQFGT